MQAALKLTTTVQPGGKLEVTDAQLPAGEAVDVVILFPQETHPQRRSLQDILAESPGHLALETVEEVDSYLREERDAWEH